MKVKTVLLRSAGEITHKKKKKQVKLSQKRRKKKGRQRKCYKVKDDVKRM